MNILEGIKRLYIALSFFIVAGATFGGWTKGNPPYGCIDLSKVSPGDDLSQMRNIVICPSAAEQQMSHIAGAAVYGIGTALVLAVLWFIFRWIIAGFFPTRSSKK